MLFAARSRTQLMDASEVTVLPRAIPLSQHYIDTHAFVERPALVAAALPDLQRGLLVLTAPAGYGKSWLSGQIASHWSEGGEHGHKTVRTWTLRTTTTLTQALRSFCELFGHTDIPSLLNPDVAADTALEALACGPDTGMLVVDMDGAPPCRAVKSLASQVLTEFVTQGRALLVCRTPWLLSLERVALSATVQVFEAQQLAFGVDELVQLHHIDRASAERWIELTEGWPILCGRRLPVSEKPLVQSAAEITRTLADGLADYLEHELLSSLPARDVNLLMQASIFAAVEPGMLEALEPGASWTRLSGLQESGLPISVQHSARDHIVLHPVFRAFLEHRLSTRSPALHNSLHRRAAIGYAATNHHRLALAHAVKTRDSVFVSQITESSGGWRISWREGFHVLDNGTPDPAISAQFPRAYLARSYWLTQTGRLDDAERMLCALKPDSEGFKADFDTISAVLGVYRDLPHDEAQVERLITHSQHASSYESALGPSSGTVAAAMLNNAGLYRRAVPVTRAASIEANALGSRYVELYGSWQCAIALHGLGRINEALGEYERTASLVEEVMGEASNEFRLVSLDAAHAAYLAGNDDLAERLAGDLTGLYRLHAWFESYVRALEAATALSRQRADHMLEEHVLQSFSDLTERRHLPRLSVMVSLGRAQQATADGDLATAEKYCRSAQRLIEEHLPAGLAGTQRVLAPTYLETTRIALLGGNIKAAAETLANMKQALGELHDGSIRLESQLFEAYVALHGRHHQQAARLLSQSVAQAKRQGLVRPFRNNAGFVGELAEFARSRALNFDPATLQAALDLSAAGLDATSDTHPRRNSNNKGRLLLTDREMDILNFLSDGLSSKEMARRLRIAEGTIKTHRKHLYEKLNVGLRSQAITKARELGLL